MTHQLKGGFVTEDPRLDRLVSFDEKSRDYPIRTLLTPEQQRRPRSYSWSCFTFLDQGREGACVGFAWAHELAARPLLVKADPALAMRIYKEAQKIDEWPGEDYSGTSVLAGAKIANSLGYMAEYRWAFGLDDLVLALGYKGPAVLGIPWYSGMFNTDAQGFIHVTGKVSGGHAILCRGVNVANEYLVLHNSWGDDWGQKATAKISFADMDRLLRERGEACIPVRRSHAPTK